MILQKKGQEIVERLSETFENGLQAYSNHNGKLPKHIILFRDGVGDSQRRAVLQKEVGQFYEAIANMYNK